VTASAFKAFGQHLRNLRRRRGLTAKEAAALSGQVAHDSAGRFSRPYLAQLEAGRPIAVSLPKLATLAAILDTPVEQLIARLPREQRERLKAALAAARGARQPLPKPLKRLPHVVREIDHDLDGRLKPTAERVSLPLGYEDAARDAVRECLCWATVLPFLASWRKRQAALRRFWALDTSVFDTGLYVARERPDQADGAWYAAACEFLKFLVYENRVGPDLLHLVRSWTADFSRAGMFPEVALLTCRLRDERHDSRYGIHDLPIPALRAVRAREVSILLRDALPTDDPRRAPLAPLDHAVADCLAILVDPIAGLPVLYPAEPGPLGVALRQMCASVPALGAPGPPHPVASGLADLLNKLLPVVDGTRGA
jgi:transcriptional regulator with XRE-family HTH domain